MTFTFTPDDCQDYIDLDDADLYVRITAVDNL